MAKKSNVATIVAGNFKYSIESDTIVDITTTSSHVYKEVRVVGVSTMGDCLRVVDKDGIAEIPSRLIANIVDSTKTDFPGVTCTKVKK